MYVCHSFNHDLDSLVNKEKATSAYYCQLYANVGVISSRIVFLSYTVTHPGADSC